MAFMQLVGFEESPSRSRRCPIAWIILAEDGQPGRRDQIGGRLTRKLPGQR
jgi:hypothetical protein